MSDSEYWACDDMISFPEPPPIGVPVLTSFDGFGFSMNGMVHDITAADLEDLTTPMFAPEGSRKAPYAGEIDRDPPKKGRR